MTLSRRQFIASLAAAPLAAHGLAAFEGDRLMRIGVQLYTVRDQMAKDVAGTLAAIAEAGYSEVETAGYGGLSPTSFNEAMKAAGLTAPSAHVPIEMVMAQPDQLLETAEILDYRYLVVPWLSPDMRNMESYVKLVDTLNSFGEAVKKAGRQLAYHNHEFEFENLDGTVPYDMMLAECDPDLVHFELDLFWAAHAGIDANAYFRANPGRFPLCHIKDRTADGKMVDVGDGEIDFASHFNAGRVGGLKHYFVEHDNPGDSLASIRNSMKVVKQIRF